MKKTCHLFCDDNIKKYIQKYAAKGVCLKQTSPTMMRSREALGGAFKRTRVHTTNCGAAHAAALSPKRANAITLFQLGRQRYAELAAGTADITHLNYLLAVESPPSHTTHSSLTPPPGAAARRLSGKSARDRPWQSAHPLPTQFKPPLTDSESVEFHVKMCVERVRCDCGGLDQISLVEMLGRIV